MINVDSKYINIPIVIGTNR